MGKITKPAVEIKPVAWSGDVVLKYQGFLTVTRPDGKKKLMSGDPMSTTDAAKASLRHEILQRQQDVTAALSAIKEFA